MGFSKLISISGFPGLYKVVARSANGFIVESLADGKKMPAYPHYKISTLEDISVYTTGETVPLKAVLNKMYEKHNGAVGPDHKGEEGSLTSYFKEILPDYDPQKVHFSDIRKLVSWYNILHNTDYLKPGQPEKEADGKQDLDIDSDKLKNPIHTVQKDNKHGQVKTHAPKVKPQGVRKTGVA